MSYRLLTVCLLTFLLSGSVNSASAQLSDAQLQKWLEKYPDADTNGDGKLSAEEARIHIRSMHEARRKQRRKNRPAADHANVSYGSHERHVFDLWLPVEKQVADTTPKRPVYVFFHGGGFVGGDKRSFDPSPFLSAGMAVVSANYRFVDGKNTLSPAPLQDGARVIQYLRTRAEEWNLDEARIAVSGSSAGAVMTLWIGYHDDLAIPDSDDPVARQSSRVRCIVPLDGPTNLDPRWITDNLGGPRQVHQSFPLMFGAGVDGIDRPEIHSRVMESSAMPHLSADDPPTLLIYGGALEGIPLPESASTGVLIHHPWFGKALKEQLEKQGIPCQFHHSMGGARKRHSVILKWLKEHLLQNEQN